VNSGEPTEDFGRIAPLAHADACERNKEPILAVLREVFAGCRRVLEIGSGTGQHAVHFTLQMPALVWQPTELPAAMPGLRRRVLYEGPVNLRAPHELDVTGEDWPEMRYDGLFSANTLHIMAWPAVVALFARLPQVLRPPGIVAIYGPFRFDGDYTSASNAAFDRMLHERDPASGLRDFEAVDALACAAGFTFAANHPMPANNHTLVWRMT